MCSVQQRSALSSVIFSTFYCAPRPVLACLAIYRQIRDFGPGLCRGDRDLALAIDRQSPKIRDIEPQKLAISANLSITWRFWRNIKGIGQNPKSIEIRQFYLTLHKTKKSSFKIKIFQAMKMFLSIDIFGKRIQY